MFIEVDVVRAQCIVRAVGNVYAAFGIPGEVFQEAVGDANGIKRRLIDLRESPACPNVERFTPRAAKCVTPQRVCLVGESSKDHSRVEPGRNGQADRMRSF